MKTVAVSGGFDPIHIGHIRNICGATELGNRVLVILTRDDQLRMKKGYVFMPYEERREILENIAGVNKVVENIDDGIECYKSLLLYKPDIFAKGGDRNPGNIPYKEVEICQAIGCQIRYNIGGGKIRSSSSLVKNIKR